MAPGPRPRPEAAARRPGLARTKLQPPRLRGDLLPRPRLAASLRAAIGEARCVLVSAPAGSGKTTLIAQALTGHGDTGTRGHGDTGTSVSFDRLPPSSPPPVPMSPHPPPAVAWLSLDAHDDELRRFLPALAAACAGLAPGAGREAQALLDDASMADDELALALAEALANDLLDGVDGPAALVLDDLHVLSAPAIFAALERLVELLPPAVTLVIATRHDPPLPLARWRVRGALAELRLGDLRFSRAEAAALLRARLGAELDGPELDTLHRRVEGWPAGLGLLVGSLERIGSSGERTRFLAGLAQLDRSLYDYLAAEVLERQDPFVRMFLIETATLQDLTPELCAAVTGRDDAAALLDELYTRNLFLVALDGGPSGRAGAPTYRYHDLFRQFLQARLRRDAPEWAAHLERRAARAAASLGQQPVCTVPAPGLPHAAPEPAAQDGLTGREVEVLQLVALGLSNQAIADRLVISLHTAKRHVANILEKLEAGSRTEAAARAHAMGIA